MKISDFKNVRFEEEDGEPMTKITADSEMAIRFNYLHNDYCLYVDLDKEGFLLPTVTHKSAWEDDKGEYYKCFHCTHENKNDNFCHYLNVHADKLMRILFTFDTVCEETKYLLSKIK